MGILYLSTDMNRTETVLSRQQALLLKDLRPKPFTYGPRMLAEPPPPAVVLRCTPTRQKAADAAAPRAMIELTVQNPDATARIDEPVVLPVSAIPACIR